MASHRTASVFTIEVDEDKKKALENRAQWYEAKWCAMDQPEWNPATFLNAVEVAPRTKLVSLEVEISRERIALLNAYKRVGQFASIRVNNGMEYQIKPASAPFPQVLNRDPLYIVRGDQSAYDVKIATEPTRVKAQLDLIVTEESCPDLYLLQEDTPVDVGPFRGAGLSIRGGPMAVYRYPTVVLFVEGNGISTARALIESTEDIPNLSFPYREEVRLYYKAPNEESFIFKDRFEDWKKQNVRVFTTTNSFQDAFDDDTTLVYAPEQTLAVILTGGDPETEKAALDVCKEAEIQCVVKESDPAVETEYLRTGARQI